MQALLPLLQHSSSQEFQRFSTALRHKCWREVTPPSAALPTLWAELLLLTPDMSGRKALLLNPAIHTSKARIRFIAENSSSRTCVFFLMCWVFKSRRCCIQVCCSILESSQSSTPDSDKIQAQHSNHFSLVFFGHHDYFSTKSPAQVFSQTICLCCTSRQPSHWQHCLLLWKAQGRAHPSRTAWKQMTIDPQAAVYTEQGNSLNKTFTRQEEQLLYHSFHHSLLQFLHTPHFSATQCRLKAQLHEMGTELQLQDRRAAASELPPLFVDVLTYPRIRNPSFGVLKCWQQSHCKVVSHVQQFVVIILNGHVTKRLFGICNYYVGRKQAAQNPIGKGKELQVLSLIWTFSS